MYVAFSQVRSGEFQKFFLEDKEELIVKNYVYRELYTEKILVLPTIVKLLYYWLGANAVRNLYALASEKGRIYGFRAAFAPDLQ